MMKCPSVSKCPRPTTGGGGGVGRGGGGIRRLCRILKVQSSRIVCCFGSWTSCGSTCTRILLIIVNFAFLVCGFVMVGLGLVMYVDKESMIYVNLLHRLPSTGFLIVLEQLPTAFVSVGAILILLSFLGCYGACAENVCYLSLYTVFVFLLLGAEIVVGIIFIIFRDRLLRRMEIFMQHQIRFEYNRTATARNVTNETTYQVTSIWDTMQVALNCCGGLGPEDYQFSAWFNLSREVEGVFVPPSCCVLYNDDPRLPRVVNEDICQIDAILERKESIALKTQGCKDSAVKWLSANTNTVIAAAANLIALQILHMIFACSLLSRLQRSHSDYEWYPDNDCE